MYDLFSLIALQLYLLFSVSLIAWKSASTKSML